MLIMPGSYRDQGAFARLFCDLPSYLALVTPVTGPEGRSVQTSGRCQVEDKNSLHCIVKVLVFSPLPHHIAVVFVGGQFTEL